MADSRSPSPARNGEQERIRVPVPVPRAAADGDSDMQQRRKVRERELELEEINRELAAQPGGAVALSEKKQKDDGRAEMAKLALTRGGGTYIPPHRMRAMMAEQAAQDPASTEHQRMTWEALRKSINGLINKVNVANIKFIVPELFGENLKRGRGPFARSMMRAQASSLPFTPVFACLLAIVNSKLPDVGELVVTRLIVQFRRAIKRNDKPTCVATLTFLAHLCNQRVCTETLAMEILQMLLDEPTDDSVELAVNFTREVGLLLQEEEPRFNNALYEMFRGVLHSPRIDKRVQFMVEVLFQVRRDKFKDNPMIPEGLDLVEEDDQITHQIGIADQLQVQETLNIFKYDPDYELHEEEYRAIRDSILGSDSEEEDGSAADSEDASDDEAAGGEDLTGTIDIHDHTETNLVNLRRRIYLTIMSALDFQEAVHKLLQVPLQAGQEIELCNMIVECCSQERSYSKFYGSIAERLCKLNMVWADSFEASFRQYYETIHRYETGRLRNIARLFGHALGSDSLPWTVLEVIRVNEDDTNSSSRIFIKILIQEMSEMIGMPRLRQRFDEPDMAYHYQHMFPMDNPKNTRFSINFWTSIGMGQLTEGMREHLKNMPAQIMAQQRQAIDAASSSSSDSDSSSDVSTSSGSSSSGSRSRSGSSSSGSDSTRYSGRRRRRRASSSPPPRRRGRRASSSPPPPPKRRGRADSRSVSPPPRRRMDSRSPAPPSRRRMDSRSRSPPPKRRMDSRSPPPPRRRADSRSPPPPVRRRMDSRSPPPPPARRRRYSDSVSPPPPRRARRYSDSVSPPPAAAGRRRRSPSYSRSPSPPPPRRRRRSPSPAVDPRDRDVSPRPPASKRARAADFLDGERR